MSFDFVKYRETKEVVPLIIEGKQKYYLDLNNIENSWSGRLDVQISNTFILESVQLIVNAITLFEQGYFDCAYYSLRQSLEVSTTMTYLVDMDEKSREDELSKWRSQSRFPMYGQMIQMLEGNGSVYADMKRTLTDYFDELQHTKKRLNKIIHKQGFNTFYISRNHPVNRGKGIEKFIEEFELHLKKCIGAVAIFRLTIDPFPILLNDPDVYVRTGDFLTTAYSDDFIKEYIGLENIELYKKTEMYHDLYEELMTNEPMNKFATFVVKDKFIDRENINEIFKQKHLLSKVDLVAVLLVSSSEKISKVYCYGGIHWYFSTTETNRRQSSWNSQDFKSFEESKQNFNLVYDEVFISTIDIHDECYFIEHNQEFNEEEIRKLEDLKPLMSNSIN